VTIAPPVAEAEVVRRAQAGDRAAFEELYESYLTRIFDYALGMLRNRADAEDVASETFLRAVEKLGELRDPDAFKGWLYAIARNAALRIVDARKRAVPVDDHNEDATALDAAPLPAPDEYEDMRTLFDEAASTLSEKERTVYELSVRHGLGSAEIGKVLGVRPAYAYILVNRLKSSVTEAAEAVALARVGGGACESLAHVLEGVDPVSSRGRKAVARHARSCEICAETKRRRASLPAMMQGVAFAEPGREFRRELSRKIDTSWGSGAGVAAGAGMAAMVGAIVAVVVVSVGLVAGAAQRTLVHHEPKRVVAPLVGATPAPTIAPTEDPGSFVPSGPVATPQPSSGTVVVLNSGNTGVTTGTSSSSSSSSSGEPDKTPAPTLPPQRGG
jgi:RNA polymerase sigma factor (sigma-70 family)